MSAGNFYTDTNGIAFHDEDHSEPEPAFKRAETDFFSNATVQTKAEPAVNVPESLFNPPTILDETLDESPESNPADDPRSAWRHSLRLRIEQLETAQAEEQSKATERFVSSLRGSPSLGNLSNDSARFLFSGKSDSGVLNGKAMRWIFAILLGLGLIWLMADAGKSPPKTESTPLNISTTDVTNPIFAPAAPGSTPLVAAVAPSVPVPPPPTVDESARIGELIEQWRLAWQSRDATSYLAFYSPGFIPARGQSRADWEAARRKALNRPDGIAVKIVDLRIESLNEKQMKAEFLQDYSSGKYREVAQLKTLLFERSGTDWKISREWQGAQ
ncbi:MAG: hypothetical protein IPH54_18565 [Rhodoferax sp.]|nr:hypothetical protein [Rhodoferax sp.]